MCQVTLSHTMLSLEFLHTDYSLRVVRKKITASNEEDPVDEKKNKLSEKTQNDLFTRPGTSASVTNQSNSDNIKEKPRLMKMKTNNRKVNL